MQTEEKESLVSRRSFFRSTAQVVLPMLALAILSSCAQPKKLTDTPSTCKGSCGGVCKDTCYYTCTGTHKGMCSTCSYQCKGTCNYACQGTVKCSTCSDSCKGSCHRTCSGSCQSSAKNSDTSKFNW